MSRNTLIAVIVVVLVLAATALGVAWILRPKPNPNEDPLACREAGGSWVPAGDHVHTVPDPETGSLIHYHPEASCFIL